MVALSHTYITLIPVKIISINELWELMVVFSSYLSSFGFYWIGLCDILLGLNSVSVKLNVFFCGNNALNSENFKILCKSGNIT